MKENEYLFSKHFKTIFTNLNILSKYLNHLWGLLLLLITFITSNVNIYISNHVQLKQEKSWSNITIQGAFHGIKGKNLFSNAMTKNYIFWCVVYVFVNSC